MIKVTHDIVSKSNCLDDYIDFDTAIDTCNGQFLQKHAIYFDVPFVKSILCTRSDKCTDPYLQQFNPLTLIYVH